ncbi:hypothetical protein RM844_28605 [Streptomyces sp. DSM 44915]|uniref:Uncharacterized protein n=1 Tax=Streptomyces chisholmiae TaxID=3075540 RepID=A0ABU2JZP7_9ACTN|nr:hypothetical protein [Streptomyces sp. DSM 44915]MDT0270238.1 hypothetical protein [Streptomyces sp. DSM 44915]
MLVMLLSTTVSAGYLAVLLWAMREFTTRPPADREDPTPDDRTPS